MFVGNSQTKIDSKGRVLISKKYIDKIREEEKEVVFILHRGFHKHCLFLYTATTWTRHLKPLLKILRANDATKQNALRNYLAAAEEIRPDTSNRLTLRKDLLQSAGLEKDVVLAGVFDRLELWDKTRYDNAVPATDVHSLDNDYDTLMDRGGERSRESK